VVVVMALAIFAGCLVFGLVFVLLDLMLPYGDERDA
jgi:hypothetical protein